ncbi:hypothetical protein MMPV_006244 [Pyropia vietnamensis]
MASVHAFVSRRFGAEVADRIVDAGVAGIYSASSKVLDVAYALPSLADAERRAGSVVLGMATAGRVTRRAAATAAVTTAGASPGGGSPPAGTVADDGGIGDGGGGGGGGASVAAAGGAPSPLPHARRCGRRSISSAAWRRSLVRSHHQCVTPPRAVASAPLPA